MTGIGLSPYFLFGPSTTARTIARLDLDRGRQRVNNLKKFIRNGRSFTKPCVVSELGTFRSEKCRNQSDRGDSDVRKTHTFRGVGETGLPAANLGELNYDLYAKRLFEKVPNLPLTLDHLDESDVPRAKIFVDETPGSLIA